MEENDLPLLQLFTNLREAGLPIGIEEYQLVLQALQGGFGMTNPAALKRLCQTLWIKSAEEKQLFEYHFEQLMGSNSERLYAHNVVATLATPSKRRQIASITISVIQGILAFGIILGATSSNKQQTQNNLSKNTPTIIAKAIPTPTPTPTPTQTQSPKTSKIPITTTPLLKPTVIATRIATLIPTPTQTNRNQPNLIWMLPVIALGGGFVIFRWVIKQKESKQKSAFLDEVQVAQAVQQTTRIEKDIPENLFILIDEYFPVTERQMKQIWRYLRRPVRQGAPTVLDVEATVHQIGRQGILLKPVLVPRRVNQAELLLLIDQDGSMVPFGELSHRLAETALRGGLLGKAGIYYFHNCPIEYLYHDSNLVEAELVHDVVTNVCSQRTAVLIFSDAGAARGGNSEERYELTQQFLSQIKQRVRYIAWLNPLPRKRWTGTTAGDIARLVPMFEVSRRGLQDAIGVLRGRPTNFEGRRI
ncbi:MAG: hypothetical protein PUP91_00220 [Rhizonema sp. PD37]|nr:hypothetical protein [Rhizonema sp. PD37]